VGESSSKVGGFFFSPILLCKLSFIAQLSHICVKIPVSFRTTLISLEFTQLNVVDFKKHIFEQQAGNRVFGTFSRSRRRRAAPFIAFQMSFQTQFTHLVITDMDQSTTFSLLLDFYVLSG
jgi:hypothetical protein